MIICSCNLLSDDDVRRAARAGSQPLTARQVYDCLGCAAWCGRCARTITLIIQEAWATGEAAAARAGDGRRYFTDSCARVPHRAPSSAASRDPRSIE